MTLRNYFLIALTLTAFSCSQKKPATQEAKGDFPTNGIVFYKIDNQAIVELDGNVIYDSDIIDEDPELHIIVDFAKHSVSSNSQLTVKCNNSPCIGCDENPWGIVFEVFKNGEMVDYYNEKSTGTSSGGTVFEQTITWGEL